MDFCIGEKYHIKKQPQLHGYNVQHTNCCIFLQKSIVQFNQIQLSYTTLHRTNMQQTTALLKEINYSKQLMANSVNCINSTQRFGFASHNLYIYKSMTCMSRCDQLITSVTLADIQLITASNVRWQQAATLATKRAIPCAKRPYHYGSSNWQ
jgi:hypothetical protein